MPFFSRVFKHKDGPTASPQSRKHAEFGEKEPVAPPKPRWEEAWSRKEVAPEEVHELIRLCTQEIKSRGLDTPFLLLPFRPDSDSRAARSFILNFFRAQGSGQYTGEYLQRELRLTEPMVLCSIMKWCWSRLPGGVITWDVYELFRTGEKDSNMDRHAFQTFIPLSVDSEARKQIIFDFFDFLAATAARAKTNGFGARKLSRLAGWWAFEHSDMGKGFDGGYQSWTNAADATSHLFFAYLRSLSPNPTIGGLSTLPRSLQALVAQTEYPPQLPPLMRSYTSKVVMIVDSVSPTPFALLRRAKHFEYRDDDEALQQFSVFDDPVQALTEECRRVLKAISSTNESSISSDAATERQRHVSWSHFADTGFSDFGGQTATHAANGAGLSGRSGAYAATRPDLRSQADKAADIGRPMTPSWADFLSSGFAEDQGSPAPAFLMLPHDKVLPPIGSARGHSSQSHKRNHNKDELEPGELASISKFMLDETFWWVWMTSLSGEEPAERKAVFGRCAVIETDILGARWLVMEEQVKGATAEPEEGAYIAPSKKSRFSFTKRGRRSTGKKASPPTVEPFDRNKSTTPTGKSSIGPDQHAKIQAAAARLKEQNQALERGRERRGRIDNQADTKTNSVFTLQPLIMSEAGAALKWANDFDRDNVRAKYLGDINAGKGRSQESPANASYVNLPSTNGITTPPDSKKSMDRDLPALPPSEVDLAAPKSERQPVSSLPVTSLAHLQSNDDLSVNTAEVPQPVSETLADEKPRLSESNEPEQHPAYRQDLPQRKPVPLPPTKEATETTREVEGSQPFSSAKEIVSPPSQDRKLKKTGATGNGGFKKLFGRKREDAAPVSTATSPTPNKNAGLRKPPTLGRRISVLRKKNAPPLAAPVVVPIAAPVKDSPADSMLKEDAVIPETYVKPEPTLDTPPNGRVDDTMLETPPIMIPEQERTYNASQQFNQGPLEDVPAFLPTDSTDASTTESPEFEEPPQIGEAIRQHFNTRAAAMLAPPVNSYQPQGYPPQPYEYVHRESPTFEPIHEEPEQESVPDDESEASVELARQVSPVGDRWAQIRKNAAERAAASRISEGSQSQHSYGHSQSTRTDDGETSGEETIENRVARIKARVAELTGNMDVSNQPPRRPQGVPVNSLGV